MKRRTLLAAATALVPTAGCLTSASDSPDGATGGDTTTRGNGTGSDPGAGADPGPDRGPEFEGTCPSFVDDADRTVCYDDRGETAVSLEPSTRRFEEYETSDDPATVTFTFHNGSDVAFRFNPHDWAIKRRTDEGWEHVAPRQYVEPLTDVPPGDSYEWVLSTESRQSPMAENATGVTADLTSGETYAFRVHGSLGTGDGAAVERVECVARFRYLRAVPEG